MTIEEMILRKKELGYTNEKISELSGVSFGTVQKIFGGITKAPRRETILALEKVLRKESVSGKETVSYPERKPLTLFLGEAQPQYGSAQQGEYTVEDYLALPDERRVELIDGAFYDMVSPSLIHQIILGNLYLEIKRCMEQHACDDCEVVFSPFDVQLDQNNRTMVQPDLFIMCGRETIQDCMKRGRFWGAPDFVAEVLSPSNRSHDMFLKLNKYRFAGVREYWIIDPKYQIVTVYDLSKDTPPETYDFKDMIPLLISEVKCVIDFSKIKQAIDHFS